MLRRRLVGSFGILGVCLVGASWVLWPKVRGEMMEPSSGPPRVQESTPASVEAVAVVRRDMTLSVSATGRLRPWREVEVVSELTGRVLDAPLREGQHVQEGAEVLRLDDRLARITLLEAEAELMKVRAGYAVFVGAKDEAEGRDRSAEVDAARREYERANALADEGLLASADVVRARRRLEVAEMLAGHHQSDVWAATTGLTQAEQRVVRAGLTLEQAVLEAPFSGRVADLEVTRGQQISAGDVCFRLLDESRMKVDVDVLEADLVGLKLGSRVEIQLPALPGKLFEGRIASMNPRIDEESGTARVTAVLDNSGGHLVAGQLAFVELETRLIPDSLQIPTAAVLLRQDREVVFRIVDDRAIWTYVETGQQTAEMVEIVDGLSEGDLVAIKGHFALAHEAAVRARGIDS